MNWGGLTLATILTCDLQVSCLLKADLTLYPHPCTHSSLSLLTPPTLTAPSHLPQQYLVLQGTCTWRCDQTPQPAPCRRGSAHPPTWGWEPAMAPGGSLLRKQYRQNLSLSRQKRVLVFLILKKDCFQSTDERKTHIWILMVWIFFFMQLIFLLAGLTMTRNRLRLVWVSVFLLLMFCSTRSQENKD